MLNNTTTTDSTVSETTNAFADLEATWAAAAKKARTMAIVGIVAEVAVVTGLCIGAYFLGRASK